MGRLPEINATGLWVLSAPFDTLIDTKVKYTCVSVTKLEKLEAEGHQPFIKHYVPHSLSQEKYQEDLVKQVCIITIRTDSGVLKAFPSSYLVSFPAATGIEYALIGLAVALGPMPVNTDLSLIKEEVKNLIKNKLGVDSIPKSQILSNPEIVSYDTHESITASRKLAITESFTDTSMISHLENELKSANAKIKKLEEALIEISNG